MNENDNKTTTIAFRVTEEELRRLHTIGMALGKTQSETLRFLISIVYDGTGKDAIEKAQKDLNEALNNLEKMSRIFGVGA